MASPSAAASTGPRAVAKTAEASMLVAGSIEVDETGRVEHYALDSRESLPPGVVELVDRAVPTWRFEPTLHQGAPAAVSTSMRLRLTASRLSDDQLVVRIAGASFGDATDIVDDPATRLSPPTYPRSALRGGVEATVFLVLRVGMDGAVQEIVAEQVNLRAVAAEQTMERLRATFERSATRAAADWRFKVPAGEIASGASHWSVRVPVDFEIAGKGPPVGRTGVWDRYIPGPRRSAWWVEVEDAGSADSYVAGHWYPVGHGLKLLTPLQGEG